MGRNHDVNEINLSITNVDFWSPHRGNMGGMRISWSSDIGFGTLDIVKVDGVDGEDYATAYVEPVIHAYTEHMDRGDDKEFTAKIMELLVQKLQIKE